MAAKYVSLHRYGKVNRGMKIYPKGIDTAVGDPYTVMLIYVSKGSGIDSVDECAITELRPGSRAVRTREDGGSDQLMISALDFKAYYAAVDEG